MPIQILPPEVVAKIAAGEVVERPASVVKELVENALDAEAQEIHIEILQGGRRLVRVSDDGCGIPADQVELAFARHATSKLTSAEDLYRVRTLGFRGEALASIAAVSHLTLNTRTADEPVGTSIRLEGGRILSKQAIARSRGTEVVVENLFYNTPARLKFLRAEATESAHVAQLVSSYALAFPERRFTLQSNHRLVSRTTGTGNLLDVVVALYGLDIAEQMLEIPQGAYERDGISVWGLISAPGLHRSNRRDMLFFVNRRWVQDQTLAFAVSQAYQTLLPQGKHPLVVINIALPPEEVDVNIHPTKQEVRFRQQNLVFAAVQRAVRSTLLAQPPVSAVPLPGRSTASWQSEARRLPPGMSQAAIELQTPPQMPEAFLRPAPSPPTERLPMLRVLGQIAQTYIVAEGPGGLYLIDQHAAHERIRYEALQQERAAAQIAAQTLLDPLPFELDPAKATLLEAHLEQLNAWGFEIIPFGHNAFLVKAAPTGLPSEAVVEAVIEMLDAAAQEQPGFSWEEQALLTLSCHTAVRAGQTLTHAEMQELVRQLERTALPHTCPHGRPTVIHISQAQLERQFLRH